jgi:hypothetical protein
MKQVFTLLFFLFVSLTFGITKPIAAPKMQTMTAKDAADYIYATVNAGRAFYTKEVVQRLGKTKSLKATESWEKDNTLLLPAQFLSLSAQEASEYGIGLRVKLIGLTPINKKNAPVSDLEGHALRGLTSDSNTPFTWISQSGSNWNFQALYPDVAKLESCVSCHNEHPKSLKKDWKKGDVMGGVLVKLPLSNAPLLEKGMAMEEDLMSVSPQVVADYINTILRSNRSVYSKHVVKRLKKAKVITASENWSDENTLPLPAQFLKGTSSIARKSKRGLNFRLISLWPINFLNTPANEFERKALIAVADDPLRPYFGQIKRGKHRYFQAVFPDYASNDSCVNCHNNDERSPKKDFQLDDMMGGIIVSLPLK